MINYIERGAGLHLAITKAGHSLRQENGVFVSDDDVAVQSIIDNYTIAQAQADKSKSVDQHARLKFDKIVFEKSAGEMAGWPILNNEQIKYDISKNVEDCPSIASEAMVRGISIDALAAKVKSNAAQFKFFRDSIAGIAGRHKDVIKSLTTFEDVAAYDFSTGWVV